MEPPTLDVEFVPLTERWCVFQSERDFGGGVQRERRPARERESVATALLAKAPAGWR